MKRKYNYIIYIIVIIILIFLLIINNRKLTIPEKIIKNSILWIEDKLELNKTINKEIIVEKKDEQEKELKELKKLLEIQDTYLDYELINASIIYRNNSLWYQRIIINKGSKDGINKNMAVINSDGLIGKIISTTNNTSTIKLLTSSEISNSISVKINLEDLELYGIITHYNNGYYVLEGISDNIEIKENANVVTTGMDNIFPSGILIGTVSYIKKDNFDLSKKVYIKPSVSFSNIRYVSVVKRKEL